MEVIILHTHQSVRPVGEVIAVSISHTRTVPKENQPSVHLVAGRGVEGDSHAGLSRCEVSLLGIEAIRELNRDHDVEAVPGSFTENITTVGIDLVSLHLGQLLQIGETILEVVQTGKPADSAHTYNFKGFSLLPTKGIFCRVVRGGTVRPGDPISLL